MMQILKSSAETGACVPKGGCVGSMLGRGRCDLSRPSRRVADDNPFHRFGYAVKT